MSHSSEFRHQVFADSPCQRHKFGWRQRKIKGCEWVRSQCDLHMCSCIKKLALDWRDLHHWIVDSSGFRWAGKQGNLNQSQTLMIVKHLIGHFVDNIKIVDHLVLVTKRIFIHHIARCENSGSRSQHVNASLKSSRGDCDLNSNRFKVYDLHKSFRD